MKTNVFVLYGGKSAEHEVSLITAMTIMNALDKLKYDVFPIYITKQGVWSWLGRIDHQWTHPEALMASPVETNTAASIASILHILTEVEGQSIIFPALHGTYGEDGTLQGLLELIDLAYVGNGVMSSAVGMDKVITNELLARAGIPQADFEAANLPEWQADKAKVMARLERNIGYPCYVKPANMGSSVGINRCADQEELQSALNEAFLYDRKCIIEQEIRGREVQIAVMGNDEPICSVAGEFIREQTFFDYDEKYINGPLEQRIPAEISNDVYERMTDLSRRVFRALNGSGLMRIDFFVTDKDEIYFNEVNTLPGFTSISMFPVLWEKTDGTTYPELIEKLITLGFERYEQKQNISYARVAI